MFNYKTHATRMRPRVGWARMKDHGGFTSGTHQDAVREWEQTEGSSPSRVDGHKQGLRGTMREGGMSHWCGSQRWDRKWKWPLKWAWRGTRKSRHWIMQKIYALPSDSLKTFGALAAWRCIQFLAGLLSGNSVWQLYTHRKNAFCLCATIGYAKVLVWWDAVWEN